MTDRYLQKEPNYWGKFIIDGLLVWAGFLLTYFLKRGHIEIEPRFKSYLIILTLCWFVATLFSKKFMDFPEKSETFIHKIKPFFFPIIGMTCLVSLAIYILGWYYLSRFIVYGTILVYFILEIILQICREYLMPKKDPEGAAPFIPLLFFLELFGLIAIFIFTYHYHKGSVRLTDDYLALLMGLFFLWFLIAYITHKFSIKPHINFFRTLFPFWKAEIITLGILSTIIFVLNLASYSRFIILGSLVLISIFENVMVTLIWIFSRSKQTDEIEFSLFRARAIDYELGETEIIPPATKRKYAIPRATSKTDLMPEKLKNTFLSKFPEVYQFIDETVQLKKIDILKSMVIFSSNPFNIEILEDKAMNLILNLRQMNDFRRINKNLNLINRKLVKGGLFIGRVQSLSQWRQLFFEKYPYVIARMLLLVTFIFKRVIPKLPIIKKLYFAFTKGRKRLISKAEALGRLYYCGFEVLDLRAIDNFNWFIAKKSKAPFSDKNPSYGPLFRQKRIGKNGKIIYIFKLRTMHPYSEYIHQYIYRRHQLDPSGKIKADFRITVWGKILRKLWIDELPMILNWLKGDVKLIGVRPLSETFFNTYPDDLKKIRLKHKPGLIPPYYADMPGSMPEVWESERKYFKKYERHRFRTDFIYLFKALNNILFHHAKSG